MSDSTTASKEIFAKALTTSAACLALKIGLLHLLTARERFITKQFAQTQDERHFLAPVLKLALGVVPGTGMGGTAFIERCERAAKNCAENEPYFFMLATTALSSGMMGDLSGLPTTLVQVFTVSRIGHTVSYLLGEKLNTVARTLTFMGGLLSTFTLAGLGLSAMKK